VTCHRFGFRRAVTRPQVAAKKKRRQAAALQKEARVHRRQLFWSAVTCHRFGFRCDVTTRQAAEEKAASSRRTPKRGARLYASTPLKCGESVIRIEEPVQEQTVWNEQSE